ncbi:hypothetical protein PF006_g11608 [Phytophthora fragariae]|uniref:Uncharacterized protein n=1 Tax=Phytophthora fragariae TaxID=53985 RepID=A0A6A3TWN3_9STRA|nr:hypothetical protein PF006_g11608 [Phytophthora fragariae]
MWFELVDRNGEPLGPADKLHGPLGDVADFRRALKDSRSDSADLDGVEASLLKVYKDRKTYISRIALATNDPIARFGKQMETALIVEVPKVWFQLVDGGTRRPLEDAVCLPLANLRVEKLREAAKAKFSELFPKTVKASDLKVYESWEEYNKRTGGIPLLTDSSIENFGKSRETALIVEVPKVWFQLVDGGTRRAVTVYKSMQVYKDQVEGGLLSADSIVNEHGKTSRSALILEGPKGQVDRIRRHYITDCNQEAHYCESKWWKLSVDSGYALSKLGRIISTETQLDIYKYAKSIGAGFLGTAYELLLHNAVHGAFAKSEPIVLKIPQRSEFDRIEICVQHVISSGESEQSCYDCLATLDKNTYWYPAYSFFPFIDAVTTCKAISSTSGHSDTILAYIQVTIQKHKKFKPDRLKRLNEEIDKTPQLKGLRRVFVVVGPDSDIGNTFTLRDAPDQDAFLSCFDRDQLEPQHQEEQHPPPPSEE